MLPVPGDEAVASALSRTGKSHGLGSVLEQEGRHVINFLLELEI